MLTSRDRDQIQGQLPTAIMLLARCCSFVDYDDEAKRVVVKAGRPYREGQEVMLSDERPNGELLMVRLASGDPRVHVKKGIAWRSDGDSIRRSTDMHLNTQN